MIENARDAWLRNQTLELDVRNLNWIKHREYRRILRGPPITHERAMQIASNRAPKPLSITELDLRSGNIEWPADLRGARFAVERAELDRIFYEAATRGEPLPCVEVKQAIDRMREKLREEIARMPTNRYLAARTFLVGLATAVRGERGDI